VAPVLEKTASTPVAPVSDEPVEETITTQYQKLSGTTLTGQIIDLSQFNKPKKKKKIQRLLQTNLVLRERQEPIMLIRINVRG